MNTAGRIVVGLLGILHIYILVLEMFWWDKPRGLKAFGLTQEFATQTRVLAANQGLYNGFLAAGLLWGLWLGAAGQSVQVFFLLCVLVAGLYGAATASKRILFVQAVPAAIGLGLGSFPVMCLGGLFLGYGIANMQLYRFAAVELAPAPHRAQAIS